MFVYEMILTFCNTTKNEPLKIVDFFFEKATKLFSKKKEVLLKMAELDPYGSWIQSGARFIKTGKTLS